MSPLNSHTESVLLTFIVQLIVIVAARMHGMPWREASMIGIMMNTRALMELMVVNIGFEVEVIPKSVFFMPVLMAVVTTYITTAVLRRPLRSREFEQDYLRSEFAARAEFTGLRAEA